MNCLETSYLQSLSELLKGNLEEAAELVEAGELLYNEGLSFSEGYEDKYPFIEEAVNTLLGSYDFTRCVRPNGSVYGSRGKCKKGTMQAKAVEDKSTKPSSKKVTLDPKKSLIDQATHPNTLNRKVSAKDLAEMSDKDLAVRSKYLRDAAFMGSGREQDDVEAEIKRRG